MPDAAELLRRGRDLIADPTHWTQHVCARDSEGISCRVASVTRQSLCSYGALVAVTTGTERDEVYNYLRAACEDSLVAFNDTHTHAEVLAMWDRAIALAEAERPTTQRSVW